MSDGARPHRPVFDGAPAYCSFMARQCFPVSVGRYSRRLETTGSDAKRSRSVIAEIRGRLRISDTPSSRDCRVGQCAIPGNVRTSASAILSNRSKVPEVAWAKGGGSREPADLPNRPSSSDPSAPCAGSSGENRQQAQAGIQPNGEPFLGSHVSNPDGPPYVGQHPVSDHMATTLVVPSQSLSATRSRPAFGHS